MSECALWPGLTTIPELAHGVRRLFEWHDATAEHIARRRGENVSPGQYRLRYPLQISPLPCWEDLPADQQQRQVRELISEVEQEALQERGDKPVLGVEKILAQDPHHRPKTCKRSPRPLCHASTRQAWEAFKETTRAFCAEYAEASRCFRSGELSVEFPLYSFRPPVPYGWSPSPA